MRSYSRYCVVLTSAVDLAVAFANNYPGNL